ncbi:MAG: hypothetical protein M0005_13305 [Actinomycetota bacterium]|nr:hypothetical protein [Actinomycetota bacterium]
MAVIPGVGSITASFDLTVGITFVIEDRVTVAGTSLASLVP